MILLRQKQLVICGIVLVCTGAVVAGLVLGLPNSPSNNTAQGKKVTSKTPKFESWRNPNEDKHPPYVTVPFPSQTVLGEFDDAAVSADGQPCAQIAVEILRQNGSAADATIAGMFCIGVINTQSMGLGGGFLLTYYQKASGKAYSLNARESAAAAAYEDMYREDGSLSNFGKRGSLKSMMKANLKGGLAVAVPGELRGYRELYERFGGKLPWADLVAPTIQLCENGHTVNWHMARALKKIEAAIKNEPSMSVFINPATGNVYEEGDILKRPQLAQTLKVIQNDPDALYSGQLADKLAEDIQSFDGIITAQDLLKYKPVLKEAVNISIQNGNLTMFSIEPPGSGLILGLILNIIDGYNFTPESNNPENKVLTYQRIIEAMKWAYARRTELGDADFEDMTGLTKNLTSDDFADSIRQQITDDHTFQDPAHYGAVTTTAENHGTAHFSLLAPNGDAVSATSTINLYFGAGIRSVQTGIVLNDEMGDFSAPNITNYFGIPPSPANYIKPGKRPLSSMCPAVFVDTSGDVRLVIGAAGGTKISSGVAYTSLRNLWFGDDIKEAIDARRIHHQLFPMTVSHEEGTMQDLVSGLKQIGHTTEEYGIGGSVMCGIARQNGKIYANSDFRKAGEVDGF